MTWQNSFRVIIRVIFIFAYIAFLAASIRHVATFFHNFEADTTDWVNPYTLAVSIDLTSLVLTVGVMFFRKNMPWYAQGFTWIFIVALTGFSWFVNWEYALTYQGNALHINDTLRMLNPILASSFAFLNLAYSVVAEFFSSKTETAAELAAKMDELEQLEEQQKRLADYRERTKNPSIIQRVKNTALEAREAVNEIRSGIDTVTPDPLPVEPVVSPAAQSQGQTLPEVEHKDVTTSGPTTDPTLQKVLPELPQNIDVTSAQAFAKVDEKVDQSFKKSSDRNTDQLSQKVAQTLAETSAKVLPHVTQKLAPELLQSFEQGSPEDSTKDATGKRNAITKGEAADQLKCLLKDIEGGIQSGQIKMYGSSKDKVLVSSLKNFTPGKKRRMKVVA